MADFCSKRISTVTGQVSLMPQTAVFRICPSFGGKMPKKKSENDKYMSVFKA